jgi:anaerobic ribonucleoside-triphosphate reductase activating protein
MLAPEYIDGLTLLGGEPFEPQNQRELVGLLRRVRALYPAKNVWCYTGYTYESDLLVPSRARCEVTDEMLSMIDVLVDGKFVLAQRDLMLSFRGSSNQRLIDLNKTRSEGCVVLLPLR